MRTMANADDGSGGSQPLTKAQLDFLQKLHAAKAILGGRKDSPAVSFCLLCVCACTRAAHVYVCIFLRNRG